jgi:hypothetical protein
MNEQQVKAGIRNGSIPSAVTNTGATSSIEATKDSCRNVFIPTGQQSTKAFHMPNGAVEVATGVDNSTMPYAILQRTSTLSQESNVTCYSACQNLRMQTILQFLTRTS